MKWEAYFTLGSIDMPGFGRIPQGYQTNVEAPDRETAIERATESAQTFSKKTVFSSIKPLHLFSVKVRSKRDKRRREEFVVLALDASDAKRRARYYEGVRKFGGYKPDILSVKEVGA